MNTTTHEWTETLKDGSRVLIRPIGPDDLQRNAAFLDELSPPSKHFLFLGGISRLSEATLRRLCNLDGDREMAFVALSADDTSQRQIGVCRYSLGDSVEGAEISVAVADEWQHRGLGKRLLAHLIEYARSRGIARLYSIDAATNHRMRKLARDVGFSERPDPGLPSQVICYLDLRNGQHG